MVLDSTTEIQPIQPKPADKQGRGLTLSFLLPLLSLVAWIVMVASPATMTWADLRQKASEHTGSTEPMEASMLRSSWPEVLSYVVDTATSDNAHAVEALSVPGLAVETLISLPTSWPDIWRPKGFLLDPWRCLSLPFFALPAWWFVGRGLDALFGIRRLGRTALAIGTVLCLCLLFLCFGAWVAPASSSDPTSWPIWGLVLWSALFAVFPLTWLRTRTTPQPQPRVQ